MKCLKSFKYDLMPNGGQARNTHGQAIAPLGGVLNYRTSGISSTREQATETDGKGSFCLLIKGSPHQAEVVAKKYLRIMETRGYKITEAVFTPSSDLASYYGNSVNTFQPDAYETDGAD